MVQYWDGKVWDNKYEIKIASLANEDKSALDSLYEERRALLRG